MITRLLYRCPLCGAEPWLKAGRCRACGASLRLARGGLEAVIGGRRAGIDHWYAAVRRLERLPAGGLHGGPVEVAVETRCGLFRGAGGLGAVRYGRRRLGRARLHLDDQGLALRGESLDCILPLDAMAAVTIESHTVIVNTRDQGVFFLDFPDGGGKRWEDALAAALRARHRPRTIDEFCPRIRFAAPGDTAGGRPGVRAARCRPVGPAPAPAAFETLRGAVRLLLRVLLPLRVQGRGNVPGAGPVVIAANHTSFLDAILLAAAAPRPVWFMTKNSQFDAPLLERFLVWARAFPVRRYATDPVAVRNALRILAAGQVLGLFPEGERCWDGRRQPFKRTALRLLRDAGVPVVPAAIAGAYPLMPRWRRRVRRGPVTVRFAPPLAPPAAAEDLEAFARRLNRALESP